MQVLAEVVSKSQPKQLSGYPGSHRSNNCPICSAQSKTVFDFFSHWQYELSVKEEARNAFASLHGFCHVHTWQYQQIASEQGISEGYIPLVQTIIQELHPLLDDYLPLGEKALDRMMPKVSTCPACQLLRTTEANQVQEFMQQINYPGGLDAYSTSSGLCLPHMYAVLLQVDNPVIRRAILLQQIRRLEELSEDLHNYILKRTAVHRELINREEASAWRRTLLKLVGDGFVFYGQDCSIP